MLLVGAGLFLSSFQQVGNKVEAACARSDLFERRRRLMVEWAEYLGHLGLREGLGEGVGCEAVAKDPRPTPGPDCGTEAPVRIVQEERDTRTGGIE